MADLLGNDIGLNYKGLLNLFTTINTGLDATLRVVTDGEGDSSPLYLSTTAIGLGTTSIWDNTNGRLGIGTSVPVATLNVNGGVLINSVSSIIAAAGGAMIVHTATDQNIAFNSDGTYARISVFDDAVAISKPFVFNSSLTMFTINSVEKMRLNTSGLGINNTSPVAQLDIVAAASTVGLYVKGAASTDIARFYDSANVINFYVSNSTAGSQQNIKVYNGIGMEVYNTSGYFGVRNRSIFSSPSDGVMTLSNYAISDFSRLQFGGTTSSFPSLKRSTTTLQVRLADDSDYATLHAKTYSVNGTAGFTGTGIFTSFTIEGGIITAAS